MKYRATRTFSRYRVGETYEIARPRLEDRSAIRTGLLVAASGWCAPSEAVFSIPCPSFMDTEDGPLDLPSITTVRGGIRFPDTGKRPAPTDKDWLETESIPSSKARKAHKKPAVPLTLEEIAKASGEAMEGLRG